LFSETSCHLCARAGGLLGIVVALGCLAEAPESDRSVVRAEVLLREVREVQYRTWAVSGGAEATPVDARGPHGERVIVFLSPEIESTLADRDSEGDTEDEPSHGWPVGSIAVCEGYDGSPPDRVDLLQIAAREPDGWVWAQYDERDRVLAFGRPGTCIGCHLNGDDQLMSVVE
jgi:hypothetical protein